MSYNKKKLMPLPPEEKLALVEELWDSIDEEIVFAEQRLKMHKENREEGMSWEEFRGKINKKHGF